MRINHNISALNTFSAMENNSAAQSKSLEKLSSGQRINRAGDDAAGLAISEKMRGQIRGLDQAQRNSQDAISMIQTAEGALNETQNILQRMRELSVQAGNDTNTSNDRGEIQKEINQLTSEINRIGNTTEFNTSKLLDGSNTGGFQMQIGANGGQTFTVTISDMRAVALGVSTTGGNGGGSASISGVSTFGTGNATYSSGTAQVTNSNVNSGTEFALDVTTANKASGAADVIDNAIKLVSAERSKLGSYQNRLEHTISNLGTASENLTAAESRVRDVDMAKEMINFTKNNILSQAAQAMLAQANQQPQGVLQLLR